MADFDKPQSRNEAILQNILGADNELQEPQSRIEDLLQQILEQGGTGGGGEMNVQSDWEEDDPTSDAFIQNKPTIPEEYTLPTASTSTLGGVKVDGQTTQMEGQTIYTPTVFDGKTVLFMGDSFMEGFGARVADGIETAQNPIRTPAEADAAPMRGWAQTFKARYPKSNTHNLSIYGATIAYQSNNPSLMGQLVYMFDQQLHPDYVVFDGGANDVFQGITAGSMTAEDAYATMDWDTFNYNTYQTIPCLEAIFSLFAENRPETRLLFVSPPPMDVTLTSEMQTAVNNMKATIKTVCDKWGVAHIDIIGKGSKNTIYSNNTEYYTASDKIHPLQRFYNETIGQIDEVLKQF